jgi:RNA polymerase sigma-70 factor (ECF subfamily)
MRDTAYEQQLIGRLRAGDETAVTELATDYGAKIYQLAFRYMKNREDAEEVAQDVLLKVYQKIDLFRGDAALSSWIYRITFNTAMSRLRNTRSVRAAEVADEIVPQQDGTAGADLPRRREVADWSQMADDMLMRDQMRTSLAEAVADLPAIYRDPVILRDLHGLSTEEASRRLKLKDQTLKSRLHRGRLILRERLSAFAGGLSLHKPVEAY